MSGRRGNANLTTQDKVPPGSTLTCYTTPIKPALSYAQLNIREQLYTPEFYETVSKIMKIRQDYIEGRSVFLGGRDMFSLMMGLGALAEDIPKLRIVSNNLYRDPTVPFRWSRNCCFSIDYETHTIRRLELQPYILTVEEGFKWYDSGQIRRFDVVQNAQQLNSIFQALLSFKAMLIHGVSTVHRPKLQYDRNKWVCTHSLMCVL